MMMKEQDKFIKVSIIIFILLGYVHANTIEVLPKIQLNDMVSYIEKTFEFSSKNDKKEFLSNQKLWLNIAKKDCSLVYADIGSHSSFLIYYNNCMEDMKKKRILKLKKLYLCKYSSMTGEECDVSEQSLKKNMHNTNLTMYKCSDNNNSNKETHK